MKKYIGPFLLAFACMAALFCFKQVQAADLSVYMGGASYHIGAETYTYKGETRDIQQVNPMIGVQYKQMMVFGMKNSYHRTSLGLVWTPEHQVNDWFAVGVRLGLASGYSDTPIDRPVVPVVNPYMDFALYNFHTQLGIMPSGTGDSKGIVTLNFKYDLF